VRTLLSFRHEIELNFNGLFETNAPYKYRYTVYSQETFYSLAIQS